MMNRRVGNRSPRQLTWLLSVALLSSTPLIFGCAHPMPPQPAQHRVTEKSKTIKLTIVGRALYAGGEKIAESHSGALTALPQLGAYLNERRQEEDKLKTITIFVSSHTPLLVVMQVLLSAQNAELKKVELVTSLGRVAIVLPEMAGAVPLALANAFIRVEDNSITLSHPHSVTKTPPPQLSPASMKNNEDVLDLIRTGCVSPENCQHVVVAAPENTPMGTLLPLLDELNESTAGKVSIRWMVSEAPASLASSIPQARLLAPQPTAEEFHWRKEITQVIHEKKEAFLRCSRQALSRGVQANGVVGVRFTISGLGLVFEAAVVSNQTTIEDEILSECVAEQFKKIKFPRPPEGETQLIEEIQI